MKKADTVLEPPEQAYRSGYGRRGAVGESKVQAPVYAPLLDEWLAFLERH